MLAIVLRGQEWLSCVRQCRLSGSGRRALRKPAISVRRTLCHCLIHFPVWLARCFSKLNVLRHVVWRRPVCWPPTDIKLKTSINFMLIKFSHFFEFFWCLVWNVVEVQTAVFGRRHSTTSCTEIELIWLLCINCDSVLNAGLSGTCSQCCVSRRVPLVTCRRHTNMDDLRRRLYRRCCKSTWYKQRAVL